jgi:MoxR-like ATPase
VNGIGPSGYSNQLDASTSAAAATFASADIGATPAGSTTVVNEGSDYDVTAGGPGIYNTADAFRFLYQQHTGEFQTQLGPVFTNLLLADEINRAPAKVQSALLEVMQEHQVTIGRETHRVPEPFLVMATQNPIESEGTYPLPEAQVDRFMMKVVVDYPSATEEHAIVDRALRHAEPVRAMLGPADLISMQERVLDVFVDTAVVDYAVRLVTATRRTFGAGLSDLKRYVSYGASPRASIALVTGARALAFLYGRDYVLPDDVRELALDVMRHRIVLSYEALADDVTADAIITKVLDAVAEPEVVLSGR